VELVCTVEDCSVKEQFTDGPEIKEIYFESSKYRNVHITNWLAFVTRDLQT